jgi:benzoyl-CoA reductase/2-hydroxyglutaryl-CoA dehydratase subunit BcrC/BadD/HgdB
MWENLTMDEAIEYARDPFESIRKWKAQNQRKIVGSTLADVPEEIIHAFGLLPITLLGTHKPLKKAPSLLPDNACSLARSNLELVLSYERDLFDGFVLPQVCDTTQHMCDIWRINFPDRYVENILLPRQVDRPSARYWVKEEIGRLSSSLASWCRKSGIEERNLRESIKIHNENKQLLGRLYQIKTENPGTITNKQLFSLLKLSMQVDKAELNQSLKQILANITIKQEDGHIPVILSGITCDPLELFDLFDEAKLNIVGDTLVTGSRYLQGVVDEGKNLMDSLTERHFARGFYSPIHDNVFKNAGSLHDLYGKKKAEAIIYVHIEFCESEEYDLPDLKNAMKEHHIPFHTIVTEYQTLSLSHVRTRLQAFVESVRGTAEL